jgi:hypothetical protein
MSRHSRNPAQMSTAQLAEALAQGCRLVTYEYCVSLIVVTWRRQSRVYLLAANETGLRQAAPYLLLTMFLGWWGLPWGLIYTPLALVTNLAGGRDASAYFRPPSASAQPS